MEDDQIAVRTPFEEEEIDIEKTIGSIGGLISLGRACTGRLLLYCFQKLKWQYEQDPRGTFVLSPRLEHVIIECISQTLFNLEFNGDVETIKYIWATPGFANYFLSDELFLTQDLISAKGSGMVLDFASSNVLFKSEDHLASVASGHPALSMAPSYFGIVYLFLEHTAIVHDFDAAPEIKASNPHPHSTALAAAVIRRLMQAWSDPYTRTSIAAIERGTGPAKPYPIRSLCYCKMLSSTLKHKHSIQNWMLKDEVVPGLTAWQLLSNFLNDPNFFNALTFNMTHELLHDYLFKMNKDGSQERTPFEYLNAGERLQLMDKFHDWRPEGAKFDPEFLHDGYDLRTLMILLIVGRSSKIVLEMYHAAKEDPGTRVDERTMKFLEEIRSEMMKKVEPSLAEYLKIVEPRHQKRNPGAQGLPDEIMEQIGEFSLPKAGDHFSEETVGKDFFKLPIDVGPDHFMRGDIQEYMRRMESMYGNQMDQYLSMMGFSD